jgi:AGCS family alanine or glycine:cation symporter
VFGGGAGVLLALSIFCFAYATVICWAYYGESCCRFLFGDSLAGRAFLVLFCASLILGATLRAGVIWELADFTVSLMTLINCICLLYLWREIRSETDRAGFLKKRKTPSR